jgi:hypothetical protein
MNATSTLEFRAKSHRSRQLVQGGLIFALLGADNGSLDGFKVRVTVLDVLGVPLNTTSSTRAMNNLYMAVGMLTTSWCFFRVVTIPVHVSCSPPCLSCFEHTHRILSLQTLAVPRSC